MRVYLPKRARDDDMGGGWQFSRNIQQALKDKVEFVTDPVDTDIFFIPGPTLATRDEGKLAKAAGKKIVLRVDNVPRNSRNRNTGTSRLYDFAQIADAVIYQSHWAHDFIMPFIKKDGPVILNGADQSVFNEDGPRISREGDPQYLYSRFNRDNIKRWERAWFLFQNKHFKNPKAHLWIVGSFGPNTVNYDFDFFGGAEERYRYLGLVEDRKEMAKIYRTADYFYYTYEMDACSNTLIEARLCGMKMVTDDASNSGSFKEIMGVPKSYLSLEHMGKGYLKVFKKVLS